MKTNKNKIPPYTPILNSIIQDPALSFQATGTLSYMLSKPPGWKFYVQDIKNHSGGGSKRFIQKILQELVDAGYIKKIVEQHPETNRFLGTRYVLNDSACRVFPTSKIPTDGIPDRREKGPPNNIEASNTRLLEKKEQQQQANPAIAAAAGKFIADFFEELRTHAAWRRSFEHQLIGEHQIGTAKLDLLLLSFRDSSSQRNTAYEDLRAVQTHFSNWFGKMREKDLLPAKITEQRNRQKTLRENAAEIIQQIDNVIGLAKARNFTDVEQAELALSQLPQKLERLQTLQLNILDEGTLANLSTAIDDTEQLTAKLESGQQAGKLHLICQSNTNEIQSRQP